MFNFRSSFCELKDQPGDRSKQQVKQYLKVLVALLSIFHHSSVEYGKKEIDVELKQLMAIVMAGGDEQKLFNSGDPYCS